MLNKTILVFYVNVGGLEYSDVNEYLSKFKKAIELQEEDLNNVIQYIIPVYDQETRVECINVPTLITTEMMKEEIVAKIEATNTKLERITSYFNAHSEIRKVITEKY